MTKLNLEAIRAEVPSHILTGFRVDADVEGQSRGLGRSLAKAGRAQTGKNQTEVGR